ncbi:kinase-like domain-containing protein [Rhizophagus diaphanus]|nr:kinase-like domain-containing protein [Rhizophagus diaphanus] [Rhizophagus sp. MUCL 43196]
MSSFEKVNSNNYGNCTDWVEESISKESINKFDYYDFNNRQPIGGGNFGKVFRANWKKTDILLALKSFDHNKLTLKEVVNEIKLHKQVDFHPNILRFHGITEESEQIHQMKYLLVLEYADGGTLKSYLNTHFNGLGWYDKYQLAFQLTSAVECIHECGIIHRDLHANNVLIHNKQIKLADFGLSRKIAEESDSSCNTVFGVVPYIDPKCFNDRNHKLDKKSDIYSIGVLMWQISSGREPFCTEDYDIKLALDILRGRREKPIDGTPMEYINLYKDCWKFEENERPDIKQVVSTLKEIIFSNSNNEKEEIYLTAEDIPNFELSKTSINSITDENDDLIIENISSIINSKSNVNSQDNFLNESEGMVQPNYCHSYETKVFNKCVTQNNSYKNCESIDNEIKEISNKAELIPCKKLAGKGYLGAIFNFRFGFIFSVCNPFYIEDDDNRMFSGCQQKFENYPKIQVFSIFNKEMIFPEKLNNVKEENYLTVGENPNLELRKKTSINALNFNGIVPENNNNSTLHNHSESTQLDINENKENKIAQINPDNLNKNYGYMENEFKKVSYLFNKAVKYYCDIKLYVKALKLCKKLAGKGYLDAQFQLGLFCDHEIYEINKKKAFEFYTIAAEKNHDRAQNNLGNLYENGEGVEKDFNKAFYWFKKAAENGNEVAIYNLGKCYELGIGVNKNLFKAFELYKKSAEKGDLDAMFQLGYFYINGFGTKIRKKKGFKLYNKAAGKDLKFNILTQYENDEKIINDLDKVNYWYHKAAEDDNEVALYKLGEFYELGKGVCKNKVRAFTFYKQAAEKGYKKGRYKLGYCYENGIGTYIDLEKADKITVKEENIDVLEKLEIYNQKQSIGNFKMAINCYIKAANILNMIW